MRSIHGALFLMLGWGWGWSFPVQDYSGELKERGKDPSTVSYVSPFESESRSYLSLFRERIMNGECEQSGGVHFVP